MANQERRRSAAAVPRRSAEVHGRRIRRCLCYLLAAAPLVATHHGRSVLHRCIAKLSSSAPFFFHGRHSSSLSVLQSSPHPSAVVLLPVAALPFSSSAAASSGRVPYFLHLLLLGSSHHTWFSSFIFFFKTSAHHLNFHGCRATQPHDQPPCLLCFFNG